MILLIAILAAVVIGSILLYAVVNNGKVGKKGTADTWNDVYINRLDK